MNKLMTTQLGDAQLGRNEDSYLAHVAEGEMVVPPVLSPQTQDMVNRDMMLSGLDPMQYTVGSGANSINPMTGQPEFFIKKIAKGVGSALSGAAKAVAKYAPQFAVNYATTGGNPYAAAGMTLGDVVGGDFGRTLGNIAGSYYNPATGTFTTPGFNPASMMDGREAEFVADTVSGGGFNIPDILKTGGAAYLGSQLLSELNKPYDPYGNYKPPSYAEEFIPVAIRTGLTATDYVPGTPTSPAQLTGQLAPSLQALQAMGTTAAQQLYPAYFLQAMTSRPEDIVLDEDIAARQQEIYQQGLDVLLPEMAAQQIAARDRAFGTGRLGFNLSGEAMGAGDGSGLVNVEDYTQQLAQNRALSELLLSSRGQAATEVGEAAKRQLAAAELQEANRRNYLAQIGGAGAESLQLALGLDELERINMAKAADIYLGNKQIGAKLTGQLAPGSYQPTLLSQLGSQAIATAGGKLSEKLLDTIFT